MNNLLKLKPLAIESSSEPNEDIPGSERGGEGPLPVNRVDASRQRDRGVGEALGGREEGHEDQEVGEWEGRERRL